MFLLGLLILVRILDDISRITYSSPLDWHRDMVHVGEHITVVLLGNQG